MSSSETSPPRSLLQRVAFWLAVVVIVYLVGSYVGVPIVAKSQIRTILESETGRTVRVERVHFNPLRTRLSVEGFELLDAKGEAVLIGFDDLVIDLAPLGFFSADVALDELRLVAPRIQARIDRTGELELVKLFTSEPSEAPGNEESSEGDGDEPLVIDIGSIQIESGVLDFYDASLDEPLAFTIEPFGLDVGAFTTRVDGSADYELEVGVGEASQLRWNGQVALGPIRSSGEIEWTDLDLELPWAYLASRFRFDVGGGRIGVSTRYEATFEETLDLKIESASIAVKDLSLVDAEAGEVLLLPSLEVTDIESWVESTALTSISIGDIEVEGGKIRVRRGEDGNIDLADLFSPVDADASASEPVEPEATDAAPSNASPRWGIGRVAIQAFALEFEDRSISDPVTLRLDPLNLEWTGLDSQAETPSRFRIDGVVADGGRIEAAGPVRLEPLEVDLDVVASDLALLAFAPYVESQARVRLEKGSASTRLAVSVRGSEGSSPSVGVRGDFRIADFGLKSASNGADLISWRQLRFDGLDWSPEKLRVEEIAIEQAKALVAVAKDGQSNIQAALEAPATSGRRPAGQEASPSVPPADPEDAGAVSSAQAIRIDRVVFDGVDIAFEDASVDPKFDTRLADLRGTVSEIDSGSEEPAEVELQGLIRGNAPLTIEGRVHPFRESGTNKIVLAISEMSMPEFGPYSSRYAGYQIDRGKLDMQLEYELTGRDVKGKNEFRLRRFALGDRVDGEGASLLPVPLALSLMRDLDGAIAIDLPIQGNLDDPSFNILNLMGKAFVNLVTNVARAPFSVLAGVGGLVGISADELSHVVFAPGTAAVSDEERAEIAKLGEILADRVKLTLEIRGRADPTADGFSVDERGASEAGRSLARARAEAIQEALVQGGQVSSERIFLVDVELGDFASPAGVSSELSLGVN